MMSRIGVGIVGFGTVGTGVAKILLRMPPSSAAGSVCRSKLFG